MIADDIRDLLTAKADALVRRSAEDLDRLIDPGFVYTNASGTLFDKGGYIDAYCTSGRVAFRRQEITDLRVSAFPGLAVATMLVDDAFDVDGETIKRRFRSLAVLRHVDGGWLWTAGQTMRVE